MATEILIVTADNAVRVRTVLRDGVGTESTVEAEPGERVIVRTAVPEPEPVPPPDPAAVAAAKPSITVTPTTTPAPEPAPAPAP